MFIHALRRVHVGGVGANAVLGWLWLVQAFCWAFFPVATAPIAGQRAIASLETITLGGETLIFGVLQSWPSDLCGALSWCVLWMLEQEWSKAFS
jgi:hypothetical protein